LRGRPNYWAEQSRRLRGALFQGHGQPPPSARKKRDEGLQPRKTHRGQSIFLLKQGLLGLQHCGEIEGTSTHALLGELKGAAGLRDGLALQRRLAARLHHCNECPLDI
jgi:hypothetical protein